MSKVSVFAWAVFLLGGLEASEKLVKVSFASSGEVEKSVSALEEPYRVALGEHENQLSRLEKIHKDLHEAKAELARARLRVTKLEEAHVRAHEKEVSARSALQELGRQLTGSESVLDAEERAAKLVEQAQKLLKQGPELQKK